MDYENPRPTYEPAPPPPFREPRRPPASRTPLILAILLGITSGLLIYRTIGDRIALANAEPRIVTPRGDLAADEKTTIDLFENASPSVVFVTSLAMRRSGPYGLNVDKMQQGTGSGFIWDQSGHVVTNFHVIQAGNSAEVAMSDHRTYKARVVGVAPDQDLAVLQIKAPASELRPIPVGTSKDLQVGQKVFAIGNPFGLDHTLTTGVVSALGRSIPAMNDRTIRDVIQTDAAINPGNSGGPLLDSAGRLIGVNTAIISPSGTSAGIGFAMPVDTVNRVVPQLIAHGEVTRPQLGIYTAHDSINRRLGVRGVLVMQVEEGSAADQAGLRGTSQAPDGGLVLGDIIQTIDEQPVKSQDDLLNILEKHKAGDIVRVKVLRKNEETETIEVRLQ